MKIVRLIANIFFLLVLLNIIIEYDGYTELSKPFSVFIYTFCFMLVIIFIMESKRIGYFLVLLVSYFFLMTIFSMEILLYNENKKNISWFKKRYTYTKFRFEFYLFLPIILLFYLLFFSYGKSSVPFSRKIIFEDMKRDLK